MDRLSGCLDRLMPHVRLDSIAITGGIGMHLGMAGLGRQGLRDDIADLDLVAASTGAIRPTVVEQFLVSHYHVVRPGVPKFMIQLVDPVSRIRVDVFPDLVGSLVDARTIAIGEHSVQVLPLERIFEHKLLTLSRASPSAPIDPKHVHDARVLGDVTRQAGTPPGPGSVGARRLWNRSRLVLRALSVEQPSQLAACTER